MWGELQKESDQSSKVTRKETFFRRNRMILAFLLIITTIPIILYLTHKWDSNRIISGIDIKGNNFIPVAELLNMVPDTLFKREKSRIKLKLIESAIYKHPFVRNVSLSYGLHDKIEAELGTRTPIAGLIDNKGRLTLADSEAVILPYKFFDRFPDLFIIRNAFIGDSLDQSVLITSVEILLILRNQDYRILPQVLNEIIYRRESNSFDLSILSDNVLVKIGDKIDVPTKLRNLDVFLEQYFYGKIKQKLVYIDARWAKQVIVKEK